MSIEKQITPENLTPVVESPAIVKSNKEQSKKLLKKFMDEELKLVRGIPQNHETPGGTIAVNIVKYPGHSFCKVLQDGVETEVPLYVARFLNGIDVTATGLKGKLGTCSYPISTNLMDKDGNYIISNEKRKRRYGFQSIEFGGFV
jgi:hypothetical protein